MKKQQNNLTQEELNLIEETERFMEEVNADPEVANAELPPELREKLMKKVYKKKAEHDAEAEREELVRLGRIYKKRRKTRKYWVLAAAAVLAMALGITSIGGGERILEVLHLDGLGRDQSQMNSGEGTIVVENVDEEEVYQQIEDEYGFYPVVMGYRPDGIELVDAKINDLTQTIMLYYDNNENSNIICQIFMNYRDNSHGMDTEEQIADQFEIQKENCIIHAKLHEDQEMDTRKWRVEFQYKNMTYSYIMVGIEKDEVEKIAENLYF